MNEEDRAIAKALNSLSAEKFKEALQANSARGCKDLEVAVQHLRQEIASAFLEALSEEIEGTDGDGQEDLETEAPEEEAAAPTYHVCLSCVDMDRVPLKTRQANFDFQKTVKCQAKLTCTQCRRPLEIDLGWQDLRPKPRTQERRAYAAVLKDSKETSFLQALILGLSLWKQCGVEERVLIHSPAVPEAYLEVLKRHWYLEASSWSWSEVYHREGNHRSTQEECLTMLRVLDLKYDKVLALQLGSVVISNLDDIFEVNAPAFVAISKSEDTRAWQGQKSGMTRWPLLLLQPSREALRRIGVETAHPWRTAWRTAAYRSRRGVGRSEDEIFDYLTSFFRCFSKNDFQELPSEVVCQEATWTSEARIVFCDAERPWLALKKPGSDPFEGVVRSGLADDTDFLDEVSMSFAMLERVNEHRCVAARCSLADATGRKDECDGRWRCRFCREQLLLQGAKDFQIPLPLPQHEAQELREKLGQFFITGRQRFSWVLWHEQQPSEITGWLELRPANIAWHSQYGVGAWHLWTDQRHGHQLVIFLQQREDQGHRSFVREELRYTMEYRDGSNPPIFEEQYDTRKILRPLGFTVEGPHFGTLPRVKLEAHAPAYKDPSEPGDASCTDVAKEKSTQELLVEWGDDWADNLKIQIQGRCGYRILTREGSRLREESAGELEKIPTEHDFPLRIRFEASESEKPQSTFASTGGDARAKLSYLLQPKGASSQPKAKETEPKEPSPTTATAEGTEEAVEGT